MTPTISVPTIAVTMGDPCGIGPEVIVKGLLKKEIYRYSNPFVIGDPDVISKAASSFAPGLKVRAIRKLSEADFQPGQIEVLDIFDGVKKTDSNPFPYGKLCRDAAEAALKSIEIAANLALTHEIDGIATAPIHKEGMREIGFPFPGHTEFFARAANEAQFGMMMVGGGLKIMLSSIHLPLAEAIVHLNAKALLSHIRLTAAALKFDFAIDQPHIAVAGLNPHAGEGGILGREEKSIVSPTVEMAKQEGLHVSGPYPADTLFYKLRKGAFDAAVALYHDQALIPIKLVAFGCAVNVTVGLPFIRTSVDHGTAFDIAGTGVADPGSLKAAIKLAAQMACHRYSQFSDTPPPDATT